MCFQALQMTFCVVLYKNGTTVLFNHVTVVILLPRVQCVSARQCFAQQAGGRCRELQPSVLPGTLLAFFFKLFLMPCRATPGRPRRTRGSGRSQKSAVASSCCEWSRPFQTLDLSSYHFISSSNAVSHKISKISLPIHAPLLWNKNQLVGKWTDNWMLEKS